MWNVHNLAASKRTNNDTEGWNSKWNHAVGKAGPGYYEAVLQLRLQQADTEKIFAQVADGTPPLLRRRKHVRKDERIEQYISRGGTHLRRQTSSTTTLLTPRACCVFWRERLV